MRLEQQPAHVLRSLGRQCDVWRLGHGSHFSFFGLALAPAGSFLRNVTQRAWQSCARRLRSWSCISSASEVRNCSIVIVLPARQKGTTCQKGINALNCKDLLGQTLCQWESMYGLSLVSLVDWTLISMTAVIKWEPVVVSVDIWSILEINIVQLSTLSTPWCFSWQHFTRAFHQHREPHL